MVTWPYVQDPGNDMGCYWRIETQQFEGCGCAVTATLRCACNHLTDFAASAAPPKAWGVTHITRVLHTSHTENQLHKAKVEHRQADRENTAQQVELRKRWTSVSRAPYT